MPTTRNQARMQKANNYTDCSFGDEVYTNDTEITTQSNSTNPDSTNPVSSNPVSSNPDSTNPVSTNPDNNFVQVSMFNRWEQMP